MARSLVALTGLLASITGVRVRSTRASRGSSVSAMAVRSAASSSARRGFVRSGLFSTSSLHLFITSIFRFSLLAFRSKGLPRFWVNEEFNYSCRGCCQFYFFQIRWV